MNARQELRISERDFRATIASGKLKQRQPRRRSDDHKRNLNDLLFNRYTLPIMYVGGLWILWQRAQGLM